jgi:hypothetical protein
MRLILAIFLPGVYLLTSNDGERSTRIMGIVCIIFQITLVGWLAATLVAVMWHKTPESGETLTELGEIAGELNKAEMFWRPFD